MTGPFVKQLHFLCRILIILICLTGGNASGSSLTVSPFLNIRSEYTDNLFNSVEDETEDVKTNFSLGMDLQNSDESWNSLLSAEAVVNSYSDNSELDNVDKSVNGRLRGGFSERLFFSMEAGFTSDSRNDRDLEEAGMIDGSRRLFTKKIIRNDTVVATSATYNLSETTATNLAYGLALNEFHDREFADYTSHTISFRITRSLSGALRRMDVFAQTDYYWYESLENPLENPGYGDLSERQINLESISALGGTSCDLSENLNLRIQLGSRFTSSESESKVIGGDADEADDESWKQYGEAVLGYTGEKSAWDIILYHDIRPKTGSGFFVKNTAARCRYRYAFTDNFRVGLRAGYYLNQSYDSLDSEKIDERTVRVQSNLAYSLTKTIALECQYNHSLLHDKSDNSDIKRNIIMLGISIRYPENR
jgi:hypothetical protein